MWILDNSVIVKWFFSNEVCYEKAMQVYRLVASKPNQFVIPTLCYAELIHVLSRKSQYDRSFVDESLDRFVSLGIRTLGPSTHVLRQTTRLACSGFTGYDATYLALAQELGGKWLTADYEAFKRDKGQHAFWLNEWI